MGYVALVRSEFEDAAFAQPTKLAIHPLDAVVVETPHSAGFDARVGWEGGLPYALEDVDGRLRGWCISMERRLHARLQK